MEDDVLAGAERADAAGVAHEARGPHQAGLGAEVVGELRLELLVHLQRAVEHARPGTARAEFLDGLERSALDLGVVGEPEVVVGAEHDPGLAVDHAAAALAALERAEVRIHAQLLCTEMAPKGGALVEQILAGHAAAPGLLGPLMRVGPSGRTP